jgi:hypothetical protein
MESIDIIKKMIAVVFKVMKNKRAAVQHTNELKM